jgi:catalase
MSLTTDERTLALSQELLQAFEVISGRHSGFRPMHARGILLRGSFQPSLAAATLSRAVHLNQPATSVTVRFSNFSGIPTTPDNDPGADPHGCALRFHLGEHTHTDIISHSTPYFPAGNGPEFLVMLRAIIASGAGQPDRAPLEAYLGTHPAARAFMERPKPLPASYARETYFGLTAVRFRNRADASRYGRYRIVPEEGNDFLDEALARAQSPHYLFEELTARVARGPVRFRLVAQLANEGDEVNDTTVQWPEERTLLDLGQLTFTALVPNDEREQQHLIFDPIPRVDGIEPSDDPLFELRAATYLLSGRRRRAESAAVDGPLAGG